MTTKPEKKKPVHEEKSGAVRAAVWEQDGKDGVFYKYTLERLYKAGERWASTGTFSHRDAANIAAASSLASAWIAARVSEQAASAAGKSANGTQRAPAAA